jgi:hypothetical protein
MQQRINILLLLTVILSFTLRPVFPWVEYALNKRYIASQLCVQRAIPKNHCQGKCHLRKRIAQAEQTDTTTDTSPKPQKSKAPDFNDYIPIVAYKSSLYTISTPLVNKHNSLYCSLYSSSIFNPPKQG